MSLAADCPEAAASPARMPRSLERAVVAGATLLVGVQVAVLLTTRAAAGVVLVDLAVAVSSLACLPLVFRRPVEGGVLANGLVVASHLGTTVATLAAYYVARTKSFASAITVAGVGVTAHLVVGWWRPIAGLPYGWYVLLVVIAYATLVGWGAYLQARAQLLENLRDRVRRAEAEQAQRVAEARAAERTRLAREMHDVLAHRLTLLATYAGALEFRPDSSPERLSEAAGVVRQGVREALQEVREVLTLLREPDETGEESLGAGARPQPTLVDLPRLVEEWRAAGMTIAVDADPLDGVPVRIGRDAYRVVQEGLTNARKHAPGSAVTVRARRPASEELHVEVSNPVGDGGERRESPGRSGHGLIGLEERVSLSGGELRYAGSGDEFRLDAWFRW